MRLTMCAHYLMLAVLLCALCWSVACTSPAAPSVPDYRIATGAGAAPKGSILPAPGDPLKPVNELPKP